MASKASNLALRLLSAAIISPPLLWVLFRGPRWGWLIIVAVVATLASRELYRMVIPNALSWRLAGNGLTLAWIAALIFAPSIPTLISAQVIITTVIMVLTVFRPVPVESAHIRVGWLLAGPLYIGGGMAAAALLQVLDHGPSWLLLSMMLAWFSDTGAYFVGKRFGKRPLLPSVSPSKTIEGSLGGLGGSVLGAYVAAFTYLPVLPLDRALLLGLVVGAIGQCGDLFESLIKRATGVKDSGSVLPGHGGMLDRIDAFLFTTIATWLYVVWLH